MQVQAYLLLKHNEVFNMVLLSVEKKAAIHILRYASDTNSSASAENLIYINQLLANASFQFQLIFLSYSGLWHTRIHSFHSICNRANGPMANARFTIERDRKYIGWTKFDSDTSYNGGKKKTAIQ